MPKTCWCSTLWQAVARWNKRTSPQMLPSIPPCCLDWEPQTHRINELILCHTAMSGGRYQYEGIPFRYCPWCGKSRIIPFLIPNE